MFFRGEYDFLSNFHPSPIPFLFHGQTFTMPTVENAFQAAKLLCSSEREDEATALAWLGEMSAQGPGAAKGLGRRISLDVPLWNTRSLRFMHGALRLKFAPGTELATRLLATGSIELAEDNTHGDRLWGRVDGQGENRLGVLLMLVRAELA
jgi:ribA/ribD-fused uncharacterized protein